MALPFKNTLIGVVLGLATLFAGRTYFSQIQSGVTERHREPILVSGVQEPEEMRVEPFPANKIALTPPEQMLGEALDSENGKPATLLPALNRILARYPDFSDGYMMRAIALCDAGNDRPAIIADLDHAIKSIDSSRTGKQSVASLLSTRAKMEYANDDYVTAINDLEEAIRADLGKATEFTNSGAVKPEKTGPICVWTEPDFDRLVQRFPGDYRPLVFRALYHGFFLFFEQDEKTKQDSLSRVFDDLDMAAKLNPSSTLPRLFKAEVFSRTFFFQMMSIYDPQHDELNNKMIKLLDETLAFDHDNVWALKERASMYSHLKKWRQAISDYDRVVELDPTNSTALNDGALAKIEIGDTYTAISYLNKLISNTERQLQNSISYEARAEAYVKTQQWDLAIRDLTTAISLQVGGQVLLMNINKFRALYPEYRIASGEAIARKLQQTFYPNLSYENFAKGFLHTNGSFKLPDFVVADIYLKRSDANLRSGNWDAAKVDFLRAEVGYPDAPEAVDRWREINPLTNSRVYIDMKTFNEATSDPVNIWIKQARDETGPYSLQQFELNCGARQIRMMSSANYDAAGNLIGSREGGNWASIVPDTLGETLYKGACR